MPEIKRPGFGLGDNAIHFKDKPKIPFVPNPPEAPSSVEKVDEIVKLIFTPPNENISVTVLSPQGVIEESSQYNTSFSKPLEVITGVPFFTRVSQFTKSIILSKGFLYFIALAVVSVIAYMWYARRRKDTDQSMQNEISQQLSSSKTPTDPQLVHSSLSEERDQSEDPVQIFSYYHPDIEQPKLQIEYNFVPDESDRILKDHEGKVTLYLIGERETLLLEKEEMINFDHHVEGSILLPDHIKCEQIKELKWSPSSNPIPIEPIDFLSLS